MPRVPRQLFPLAVVAVAAAAVAVYVFSQRPPSANQILADGQAAIRDGDAEKADRLADQLAAGGHAEHAALLRGEGLFRRRKFDRAEQELVKVDGNSPLYPQAAVLFGHCKLAAGDVPLAEQLFRGVLEHWPDDVEAHRGMAEVYFTLGANTKVVDELEAVARLDPADTRPWMFKGGFYSDVGLLAEAIAAYEQALERAKSPAQVKAARLGLAESLLKFGQHARAQEVLAALPESARSDPAVLAFKADALLRSGDLPAAEAAIASVVSGKSPSAAALTTAGKIAFEQGRYDRAVEWLERAAADVSYYEAHYHLAQALTRLGKAEEGAARQKRADEIKNDLQQMSQLVDVAGSRPWDRAVREKLAEVSRRLGKTDIADKWLKAAKQCPPPKS
jgi:tetratricopeptide (TPR) repeat protein